MNNQSNAQRADAEIVDAEKVDNLPAGSKNKKSSKSSKDKDKANSSVSFKDLNLSSEVLAAVSEIGYEKPSPIQALTIPHLLEGKDILGEAQTGTGKTASFALPILSKLDSKQKDPQALILTPTRELAIQVAEAFQKYASKQAKFNVLPVYGGREYSNQLKNLKRGTHVVVGTPGRVMDHIRRKTLNLSGLKTFVLDEADEMLKMGFIDDIKWIMESLPEKKQLALFSATMPAPVRKIANTYLQDPVAIKIKSKTSTADTVRQRYVKVSSNQKLEALTRILEAETIDAALIFVRTKSLTTELSDRLKARGFSSSALNGDIDQRQREKTVENLKKGKLDILVATDVAARGLDVERVSHVFNFDIPFGTEAYVHRIGRTGRAGRKGDAILFVSPRESRMLKTIEKATKSKIELMGMPSKQEIQNKRKLEFFSKIERALNSKNLDTYQGILDEFQKENEVDLTKLSSALLKLAFIEPPLEMLDTNLFEEGRGGSSGRDGSRRERPNRDRRGRSGGNRGDGANRTRSRRSEKDGEKDSPRKRRAGSEKKSERGSLKKDFKSFSAKDSSKKPSNSKKSFKKSTNKKSGAPKKSQGRKSR